MRAGGVVAKRQVEADLAARRAAIGIERRTDYRGMEPGHPVRLRGAGTGLQVLEFVAAFYEIGTDVVRWVDIRDDERFKDEQGRIRNYGRLIPVKPEQVIKVRRP